MELSNKEFKAHLAAYSECDIEGGTAANDRMLFRAGFAAGVEYYRADFYSLLAALEDILQDWNDGTVPLVYRGKPGLFDVATTRIAKARAAITKARGQ